MSQWQKSYVLTAREQAKRPISSVLSVLGRGPKMGSVVRIVGGQESFEKGMIVHSAMGRGRSMPRPIPERERDVPTLAARWKALEQRVLEMASDPNYRTRQTDSGLLILSGDQAYDITFFMGRKTPEILAPVSSTVQILAMLFHGKPCPKCGCELYYALSEYNACARCLPMIGYHRYAHLIDACYPRKAAGSTGGQ